MFLWEVLYGVTGSLLRAVQSLYVQSEGCVWVVGSKSDLFPVRVGSAAPYHDPVVIDGTL